MAGERAVERLSLAKKGDVIWLFDSQRTRYTDGKRAGRGVWILAPIEDETRQSFLLAGQKFDRVTGAARTKNEYNTGDFIAGEVDRENRIWSGASWQIADAVKRVRDPAILKQIAALAGWTPHD